MDATPGGMLMAISKTGGGGGFVLGQGQSYGGAVWS